MTMKMVDNDDSNDDDDSNNDDNDEDDDSKTAIGVHSVNLYHGTLWLTFFAAICVIDFLMPFLYINKCFHWTSDAQMSWKKNQLG